MFDMGFHTQVHSICAHVRPDRQTLLFSATFRKKVEKLARVALSDPIRVVQVKLQYLMIETHGKPFAKLFESCVRTRER